VYVFAGATLTMCSITSSANPLALPEPKSDQSTDECSRGFAANHLEASENRHADKNRNAKRNAEPKTVS
jgi:hypothetical protein